MSPEYSHQGSIPGVEMAIELSETAAKEIKHICEQQKLSPVEHMKFIWK